MLAINQNHQEMVVNELRSIFETADSDVKFTHLTDMKYTERVIKETMRLLPPGKDGFGDCDFICDVVQWYTL